MLEQRKPGCAVSGDHQRHQGHRHIVVTRLPSRTPAPLPTGRTEASSGTALIIVLAYQSVRRRADSHGKHLRGTPTAIMLRTTRRRRSTTTPASSSAGSRICHLEQLAQGRVNVQGGARLPPRSRGHRGRQHGHRQTDLFTPRVYRGRYHYSMDTRACDIPASSNRALPPQASFCGSLEGRRRHINMRVEA